MTISSRNVLCLAPNKSLSLSLPFYLLPQCILVNTTITSNKQYLRSIIELALSTNMCTLNRFIASGFFPSETQNCKAQKGNRNWLMAVNYLPPSKWCQISISIIVWNSKVLYNIDVFQNCYFIHKWDESGCGTLSCHRIYCTHFIIQLREYFYWILWFLFGVLIHVLAVEPIERWKLWDNYCMYGRERIWKFSFQMWKVI